MASCDDVRIDHQDFNRTATVRAAEPVYDSSRAKIYFVYANVHDVTYVGSTNNKAVWFREYTPATGLFGAAVAVHPGSATDVDYPSLHRMTSGRLIVSAWFNNGASVKVYESADNGATWSAATTVTAGAGLGANMGLIGDGTNVWLFNYILGGPKDLYFHKRTGVGTWDAGTLIHNGTSSSDEDYYPSISPWVNGHMFSATEAIFIVEHRTNPGSIAQSKIRQYRTTDGTTWTTSTIHDFGATFTNASIKLYLDSSGRLHLAYLSTTGGGIYNYYAGLAYSDDHGATWVDVGLPAFMQTSWPYGMTSNASAFGFAVDSQDHLYIGSMSHTESAERVAIFSGSDSVGGWSFWHQCQYVDIIAPASVNYLFFDDSHIYFMFNRNTSGVPTNFELNFLVEDFSTGGGPGPPLVEAAPSGADENNVYLRIDLANGKGWSQHYHAVSCWMSWDEGDAETGREVPIVVSGSTHINPLIQDPALIAAIWRVEARELFGKREYVTESAGVVGVRNDPLKMVIWSKRWSVQDGFSWNLVRYALLSYVRGGDPFRMEVWADDDLVIAYSIASSDDLKAALFRAVPTFNNSAQMVQIRIEDESNDPLVVDMLGYGYIEKKMRGNRA